MFTQSRRHSSCFLDRPLSYVQRLALQNTVSRFSRFRLETLLYGDDNFDDDANVATVGLLAVHEFIKFPERFKLCIL